MRQTMFRGICKRCGGTFWETSKGARGEDICDSCEELREESTRLSEFDKNEWWDVMRLAQPNITREGFDAYWEEFQEAKRQRGAQ